MFHLTINRTISFGAKPIAKWKCSDFATNKSQDITIFELEKKDFGSILELKWNWIMSSRTADEPRYSVVENAFEMIEHMFSMIKPFPQETKMFLATHNKKPCGVLVGNIPKRDHYTRQLNYSSRYYAAKDEGELDYLATWVPPNEQKLKGVGKALVAEFFNSLKKEKINDIFLKSTRPQRSYAQAFYKTLGFENLSLKNNTNSKYIIHYDDTNYGKVLPMIITKYNREISCNELANKMERQELSKISLDAEKCFNIIV